MAQNIIIYTTGTCPFCHRAKLLLESKNIEYTEISVDSQPELRQEMAQRAGRTSVPQIWICKTHVGGCDDLFAADHSGELDRLLNGSAA